MRGNYFLRRNFDKNYLWSPRHQKHRSFRSSWQGDVWRLCPRPVHPCLICTDINTETGHQELFLFYQTYAPNIYNNINNIKSMLLYQEFVAVKHMVLIIITSTFTAFQPTFCKLIQVYINMGTCISLKWIQWINMQKIG